MYGKILVPLDSSELAECSLTQVKRTASTGGDSEVILLRVVEPISANDAAAWAQAGYMITDVQNKNKDKAREYLSQIARRLTNEGVTARAEVIEGRAAESIIDYAVQNKIDLIIVSTHGKSGISRFAFGSVADKIVHHSPVPVLVVSPPGCRSNN
jgi:nucleotide-binding universal stress UspA family protein